MATRRVIVSDADTGDGWMGGHSGGSDADETLPYVEDGDGDDVLSISPDQEEIEEIMVDTAENEKDGDADDAAAVALAAQMKEKRRVKNAKKRAKKNAKLASDFERLRTGKASITELAREKHQRFLVGEVQRERANLKKQFKAKIDRQMALGAPEIAFLKGGL